VEEFRQPGNILVHNRPVGSLDGTLANYKDKLGFECLGRAAHSQSGQIRGRTAGRILLVEADALHAEYAANGVEFTRELANMPWHSREFVVKDCGGRLLAFGSNL
jgi:hypothetical protein